MTKFTILAAATAAAFLAGVVPAHAIEAVSFAIFSALYTIGIPGAIANAISLIAIPAAVAGGVVMIARKRQ